MLTHHPVKEGNICHDIIIIIFFSDTADIMVDQERLWHETIRDDSVTETEARTGGNTMKEVNPQMMHEIQVVISRLVSKAHQLINNFTTNLAENWMHVRCKFDGGKVVNRSQSGSWEHRCYGAGLEQNLGKCWSPQTWEQVTESCPNQIFTDVAECRARKANTDRKRKATNNSKESRRQHKYAKNDTSTAARKAYSQHDTGIQPDEIIDDVSPEYLASLKESFYNSRVKVTQEVADSIEHSTQQQSESAEWMKEREKRITASRVGSIAKMKKTTKKSKKVEELLYNTFRGNEATRYGQEMEEKTRQEYESHQQVNGHHGLKTQPAGLVISVETPWLAASPDNRVLDPSVHPTAGLVEYKNPFSARDMTLLEACNKATFCLKKNEKEGQITYELKRQHDYYYQVQCQLYCCKLQWCDFVVRTKKELHIERIYRDNNWWEHQIEKLKVFYFSALLPELACPRKGKGGIREPSSSSS